MKKTLIFIFVFLLFLSSCAGSDDPKTTGALITDRDPSAMIDEVYALLKDGTETAEYIPQMITEELTKNNEEYYLGISGIPYTAGAASEALVQPVTYSFTIILLKEGVDYDAQRKIIEQNVNRSKWVCAFADEALVVRTGNVIAVIMGPSAVCSELEEAFLSLYHNK